MPRHRRQPHVHKRNEGHGDHEHGRHTNQQANALARSLRNRFHRRTWRLIEQKHAIALNRIARLFWIINAEIKGAAGILITDAAIRCPAAFGTALPRTSRQSASTVAATPAMPDVIAGRIAQPGSWP